MGLPQEQHELLKRIEREIIDGYDEELELEIEDRTHEDVLAGEAGVREADDGAKAERAAYFKELFRLQGELVKLQDWVAASKRKVVVIFEGRDAAGKGGVIKRITQRLNPRVCRTVALPAPSDRERTQWYFQRYVPHLPAAGEIVLFDRSWYNRAGVERVMGFCTDAEYEEFFRSVPEFERMLVRSGVQLVKYWFSITDEEQELRFLARIHDPLKQWKLSPMDLESRRRWEEYTAAKEIMLQRTHIPEAPWWLVNAVDKKKARLNCIRHFLSLHDYAEIERPEIHLPDRERHEGYARHPLPPEMLVPEFY
ncbi:MAG TPA: polyphosphate kinase 2 [Usitatibacter sp.]|nr:polyphosphate kinase 2 [Usitatibacter sp.]